LSDELNKFSAVRRNEMAGCGCQVLSLLELLRCIVYYVYCLWLDYFPDCNEVGGTGLQILGRGKSQNVTSQSNTSGRH